MKYTEYFLERLNHHSNYEFISNKQFKKIINITKMESLICGNLENGIIRDTGIHRYRRTKTLNQLIGRKTPETLWKEILNQSF